MAKFYFSMKELSVSSYVRASAVTEAGRGGVWLDRCVSLYEREWRHSLLCKHDSLMLGLQIHLLYKSWEKTRTTCPIPAEIVPKI
jgi:hypothetical protein